MIKPVDILGFGPKREVSNNDDGTFTVTVTPPAITKLKPQTVKLTADQFRRFKQWQDGEGLIQEMLSDLSGADREILITGIDNETFERMRIMPEKDQGDQ